MKIIYETIGAAKEYCEYAVDVYNGCPHKCKYCYAKAKAEKKNKDFTKVEVKEGMYEGVKALLDKDVEFKGRTIFLGFSSDPFPTGYDCTATIEMIKLLKSYGCHIMFCTKGKISDEVINILDAEDSVGITITCGDEMAAIYEPDSLAPSERINMKTGASLIAALIRSSNFLPFTATSSPFSKPRLRISEPSLVGCLR